ncbi:zinc finger protein SNAI2 [Carlito syrichta]|uniref:Zinc finger protein SNAI2 n=1 Tax=Carlito syrichta TaxID=1868482 RepID=A0A1U7U9K2_CARSF|nr:zinc finger protein SNAI2 [Carlito syrichta]
MPVSTEQKKTTQHLQIPGQLSQTLCSDSTDGTVLLENGLTIMIISPYLYESYPMPVIPQPEVLNSGAYSPITVWTTTAPFHAPLPSGLSPLAGYPSSLGRVSPPPPSDTSSKDHSGSESPISDEEERLQSKLSDPHAIEAEKFQCNLCNKTYSTFSGLAKHKQLHCDAQSRKSFSCKYCDKEYVSLGALKMHIRTHTLPCVCKICGKAFSRPWLLQGHIRTHTGEKPFSCPHCNRAFADRSNLRAHLQTHSDVKKYQCKNCSKTFSRMSLLHKHEESGCCVAH